jgi:hypothetical protein
MESGNCFECKNILSLKASFCPNCGAPRVDSEITNNPTNNRIDQSNDDTSTKGTSRLIFKITVGTLFIFSLLFLAVPAMRKQQDDNWRHSQNRIGWITGDIKPNRLTCGELLDEVSTRNFENSLRDTIRLLSYQDTHLVSQDEDRLECMAQALFTTGSEGRFIFYIEINDGKQNIGFRRP